jgi:hypothetical protein
MFIYLFYLSNSAREGLRLLVAALRSDCTLPRNVDEALLAVTQPD